MSGNSKSSNGLSFSSLVRVLPKSAPSTPQGHLESRKESRSDYFSFRRRSRVGSTPSAVDEKEKIKEPDSPRPARRPVKPRGVPPPLVMSPTSTYSTAGSTGTGVTSPTLASAKRFSTAGSIVSRHGSISSLSFKMPSDSQPQGEPKGKTGRIRDSSPPPERFRSHVAFDSVPAGDATKNNTASVVLNYKHQGYHPTRRSRTFMVGLDDHSYSDYALEYLLAALVDDGDHVVCVTVMEKDVRSLENSYRDQARTLMKKLLEKNYELTDDAAINFTLEYAVGKLHNTFQRLIQIYQPGMLIVGTRGRSGGIQGLMGSRNSFSKYCLQYSPIPVVVVRPDEQRLKKKNKRKLDPARGSYARILARSAGGIHEADSGGTSNVFQLESKLSKDEEAHKVAQAIGLPASFDPTLKPLDLDKYISHKHAVQPITSEPTLEVPKEVDVGGSDVEDVSGDEDEEDEEEVEAEFEVETIHVTKQQKERLHMMEMGEAAALLKHENDGDDDGDDDDEDTEGDDAKQPKDKVEDTGSLEDLKKTTHNEGEGGKKA